MKEEDVLNRTVSWLRKDGWRCIYLTRPATTRAIGGVDAILIKTKPTKFVFVEAKGSTNNKARRSLGFTNCLGALVKRIRFKQGYLSNEAKSCFVSANGKDVKKYRAILRSTAIHANSEYVLALSPDYQETIRSGLDPALASLLHIRVLLVSTTTLTEMQW